MAGAHVLLLDTFGANGAIVTNTLVKRTDAVTVETATAGARCVGIANGDVTLDDADKGKQVAVNLLGIVWCKIGSGGVTVSAQVASDATGRAVIAAPNDVPAGIAWGDGDEDDLVPVFLTPGVGYLEFPGS